MRGNKVVMSGFLSEDEKIVELVDTRFKVVFRHGQVTGKPGTFSWGELRTPVLTNKRIILYNEGTVDSEILLSDIKKAERSRVGGLLSGFNYLRVELKDGRYVSLIFVDIPPYAIHPNEKIKKFIDFIYYGRGGSPYVGKIVEWASIINYRIKQMK
jgi:hypothetical protein